MSEEKQINERLELLDIIDYAIRDWDDYLEECHEQGNSPIDTFEECIADSVLGAGYRKQSKNTVELPYKVGQMVYVLRSQTSNGKNLYLREERIDHYRIFGERSFMCFESGRLSVPDYLWETTVFLTQEEAEAKMKGGEQ